MTALPARAGPNAQLSCGAHARDRGQQAGGRAWRAREPEGRDPKHARNRATEPEIQ